MIQRPTFLDSIDEIRLVENEHLTSLRVERNQGCSRSNERSRRQNGRRFGGAGSVVRLAIVTLHPCTHTLTLKWKNWTEDTRKTLAKIDRSRESSDRQRDRNGGRIGRKEGRAENKTETEAVEAENR